MRHNDYSISDGCLLCGKPEFAPVLWLSKDYPMPTYKTCNHRFAEPRTKVLDRRMPKTITKQSGLSPKPFDSSNCKMFVPITIFEQLMTKNSGIAVMKLLTKHKLQFKATRELPCFTFIDVS